MMLPIVLPKAGTLGTSRALVDRIVQGLGALSGAHGNFTRVLYTDSDVMVTRSLAPLWNLVFQGHEVAAGALTLQSLTSLV